jgi:hypothetical protein
MSSSTERLAELVQTQVMLLQAHDKLRYFNASLLLIVRAVLYAVLGIADFSIALFISKEY